jgi:16S rRNA (uracil1498-N3)-methyltransferase
VEQEVREGPEVAVFQGIIKPAKMELVVEKCTELGICDFIPVITQRSLKGLSLTRIERLKRIAVEAMKQSLGAFLPGVRSPQRFNDALALLPGFGSALVAWEGEEQVNLRGILKKSRRGPVAIWIGPEGGFTPEEIGHLTSRGAATFGLGNLRLKAETAAIAAVAILRHLT